ncbi:MAG: glucoamylase family protein, partial [Lentisphaerota bacterium]
MQRFSSSYFLRLILRAVSLLVSTQVFAWSTNDWQFLETIEKANLRFFQQEKRGPYCLINDTAAYDRTNNYPAYSSVAGVGFELTAICLGHYRGWISYSNAYEQVLLQLKAFDGRLSTNTDIFPKVNGWTFHTYYIDPPNAGKRYFMDDGLSLLDHSLLIGGVIFAAEYFKGTEAGEIARKIYSDTTWSWRPNSDYDFGYSENLLAVIESAEAPQFKKGSDAKTMWNSYVVPWPRTLQLYFWEYPHSWIDFRFRIDERGYNHADVARDSILYQRQRAIEMNASDPAAFNMLNSNCWGWTAAGCSEGYRQMAPWGLWLGGTYYDAARASDSGSITPIGLPPCMIYAPTETMAAMKYIFEQYYVNGWNPGQGERPVWSDVYGFLNCMNTGRPANTNFTHLYHDINAAIDYGPNVLMLENYKLGTTWRYFMQNSSIAAGMYTVGFGPPQHITTATFSNQVNEFGASFGRWQNGASTSWVGYVTASPTNEFCKDYAVQISANGPNCGGWIDLNGSDQRAQAVLSFWIKGSTGQEGVEVGLKDAQNKEKKISLTDYFSGPLPTNWSQVKIPLETFCMTETLTEDVWPGSLSLVSFAFTNTAGGSLDVDYLSFTRDTIAPATPTNAFGVAAINQHPQVTWNPAAIERDVVGYHVWRRMDATSGFSRVTSLLAPAYQGRYSDTSITLRAGQAIRYAIQAFDNSEPPNSSAFSLEKIAVGGKLDVDWNNGCNPNVLGGTADAYWGPMATNAFPFVYTNGPDGALVWMRRSFCSAAWSGHFIDLADSDLADYWALSFYVRSTGGLAQLHIGLKDSSENERKASVDYYAESGNISTSWTQVIVPLCDFTNVNPAALRNISFTHPTPGDVYICGLAFLSGQRPLLGESLFTEGEKYTRQFGSTQRD